MQKCPDMTHNSGLEVFSLLIGLKVTMITRTVFLLRVYVTSFLNFVWSILTVSKRAFDEMMISVEINQHLSVSLRATLVNMLEELPCILTTGTLKM